MRDYEMAFVIKFDLSNFHIITDKYLSYMYSSSLFIFYFEIIIKDSVVPYQCNIVLCVYTTKEPNCVIFTPLVCHEMKLEWFIPFGDKVDRKAVEIYGVLLSLAVHNI